MTEANVDAAFLFVGGPHQVLHLAPVAAELSRSVPSLSVCCFFSDAETGAVLAQVKAAAAAPRMALVHAELPRPWRVLASLLRVRSRQKKLLLASLFPRIRRARAIITPERTSTVLRLIGWRGLLIHFRHGAGDRAPRSEKRLTAFDLVVVPGDKDVQRAIRVHHVDPARVLACGYVKLDYLAATGATAAPRLFGNDRPVVVYAPHFDPALSSWHLAREVIARFARQGRYNLIVAPHIRLSDRMTPREIDAWQALAAPDRIIDLRSPRLLDMTYLRAADVYLGDVSSQLYEFLATPRPVAFLNAHGVAWQDDPRYAGWRLGAVADDVDDVLDAIDRSVAGHAMLIERQVAAVEQAFGCYRGASVRGARAVADIVGSRAGSPPRGAG